jgi:hypothetical protein
MNTIHYVEDSGKLSREIIAKINSPRPPEGASRKEI